VNNLARTAILLAAIAAFPALAENPVDYSLEIVATLESARPAERIPTGETVYYAIRYDGVPAEVAPHLVLQVDVPGVVTDVFHLGRLSCSDGPAIRCTFSELAESSGFLSLAVRIDTPGFHTLTARLIHDGPSPDLNPVNDHIEHTLEAIALPSLELFSGFSALRIEPGERGTFGVSVRNYGGVPATNVVLNVELPAGGTIEAWRSSSSDVTCTIASGALSCTIPSLTQDRYNLSVEIDFTAPARMDGEDFVVDLFVAASEADFNPDDNRQTRSVPMVRQLVVTNTGDEGSGSLRQAIHDVNALCLALEPCAILFRIPAPVPEHGWFTIQPRTPLPEILASVRIDGRAQTAFTGDSNPLGPEIEINGALVNGESGIRLRPNCEGAVHGLAVNGFPGYGIEILGGQDLESDRCHHQVLASANVSGNYLGTDPRGLVAVPNQRGLGVSAVYTNVTDNVISGNRRSGVFVEGVYYANISRNRIGVGTDGSALGNGAGIFLNLDSPFGSGSGADVLENVIANNDMAIARTRTGEILVSKNSVFDNIQQAIDVDLDAGTPNRENDTDVPNGPVLFAATYDPVRNATIVRGRIDSSYYGNTHSIEIYASSRLSVWGMPQAEQSVALEGILTTHQDFEIVVPLDLRGKWITATHSAARFIGWVRPPATSGGRGIGGQSHQNYHPANTSELSNAVAVQ
jgi:uncharacterized repeat protein (TIGR01451 family)